MLLFVFDRWVLHFLLLLVVGGRFKRGQWELIKQKEKSTTLQYDVKK